MDLEKLKRECTRHIAQHIDAKIQVAKAELNSLIASKNSDTKSSAGDKHETGRAMMQLEVDNAQSQLGKVQKQKQDLAGISTVSTSESVAAGSLVATNQGLFFISVGIGKLDQEGHTFYAISLGSPLGQALHHRKIGDRFLFMGKEYTVEGVA